MVNLQNAEDCDSTAGDTGLVRDRVVSPALVGREPELSALLSTATATPSVAVVAGEAGIGKTRLMTELRDRLTGSEHRFLVGSCNPIREPFPLGPVLEAVRGIGNDLTRVTLSPVAGALRPLLPEISDLLPPQPPPVDDRIGERHRVFRALVEVIDSLGPVVMILEDLHWADEQTVDFVCYLLGDPPPKSAVVLTLREEDVDTRVRVLTTRLPASVARTELMLPLLDEQATGAMAAAILGTDGVSAGFAKYLHERSSGLPFAIEELLALLRARGTLARRGGRWARRTLEELDVPSGIRTSVLERVARLPADSRRVIEAAAVLQAVVPLEVLRGTSMTSEEQTLLSLEELLKAGLIDDAGEAVRFRHLLAAQAVYEAMPMARRRQLHQRAAESLSDMQPVPLGLLAHQLRYAGQVDAWVVAAEKAADQAASLGHDDESVRLLDEVLRHAPLDAIQRAKIATKLARAAIETVHGRESLDLLLDVPVDQLARPVRSEFRFWLALFLHQIGRDPLESRRLLKQAIEELDELPDLKAWAMIGLGVPSGAPGVPLTEHLQWLYRSLEVLPEVADRALATLLLGKVAMVLISVGDPEWRVLTDRVRGETGGEPQGRHEVRSYLSIGVDACYVGHHETADELLTAALVGAKACESRLLELRSRAGLALLDYSRGAWDGLRQRTDVLVEELADLGNARIDVEVVAGCLALPHGDLEEASHRLAEVVQRAESMDGFDILPLPVATQIRLETAQDNAVSAITLGMRSLTRAESKGVWAPAVRLIPPLVQAMVSAGRSDDASALVTRLVRTTGRLDVPLGPAAVRHAAGFIAAGEKRWREAADYFVAAADRYEMLDCRYDAALAHEEAAASLLAIGDAQGEPELQAAMERYRRMGATWDVARATRVARRHGVRSPAGHRGGRRGYGDRLSPRETEVAQLAAVGRTNEEIARLMFLSPKTVDKHISAALRKLGLRSRRSLAGHLDTDGAGS